MAPSHLLLPLLFSVATSEDACSISRCSPTDVPVQFPFRLVGDQERCGYPGFDLSCNSLNKTVLNIKSWGEFLVRDINYATQEIQVYDQDNCLPRKLLNLNPNLDSPFRGNYYHSFDFYNCSANFTSNDLQPIACLSMANYTIFAASSFTSTYQRSLFNSCNFSGSAMVPTLLIGYAYDVDVDVDVNSETSLHWDVPTYRKSIGRGGRCGFKNSRRNEIQCFGLAKHGLSRTVKYALSIGLGIPIILIICYLCLWGRFKTTNHHHESAALPQPVIFVMGAGRGCNTIVPQDSPW